MFDFASYPVDVTAGMTGKFSADPVSVWCDGAALLFIRRQARRAESSPAPALRHSMSKSI
jgi:hypothetical protein